MYTLNSISGTTATTILARSMVSTLTKFDEYRLDEISWEDYATLANTVRSGFNAWTNEVHSVSIQTKAPFLISWKVDREVDGEVRTKTEQAKLGRWLSKLLLKNNIVCTDAEIEKCIDTIKAEVAVDDVEIEVIKGDEIYKAYDRNYHGYDAGDMTGSCMQYEYCQQFFGIYADNPDTVEMVVIKEHGSWGDHYVARALLWTDIHGQKWMDRIYSNHMNEIILKNWAEEQGIGIVYDGAFDSHEGVTVKLQKGEFCYYPFMDSMYSLHKQETEEGTVYYLTSGGGAPDVEGHPIDYATLRDTHGGPFNFINFCASCEEAEAEEGDDYCESCQYYMNTCDHCGDRTLSEMYHVGGSDQDVCYYCYQVATANCDDCGIKFLDHYLDENHLCGHCLVERDRQAEEEQELQGVA